MNIMIKNPNKLRKSHFLHLKGYFQEAQPPLSVKDLFYRHLHNLYKAVHLMMRHQILYTDGQKFHKNNSEKLVGVLHTIWTE